MIPSTGNDLNNWSNHATKAFARYELMNNLLVLHADAWIFWRFKGALDGVEAVVSAAQGTEYEEAANRASAAIEDKGAHERDFSLNASATYRVTDMMSVSAFATNLTGPFNRYHYDSGHSNNALVPFQSVMFVEEPRSFGVRLSVEF